MKIADSRATLDITAIRTDKPIGLLLMVDDKKVNWQLAPTIK